MFAHAEEVYRLNGLTKGHCEKSSTFFSVPASPRYFVKQSALHLFATTFQTPTADMKRLRGVISGNVTEFGSRCGRQGLSVWRVLAVRIQAKRPGLCGMCFHSNSNFSPFYRVTLMTLNIR